MLRSVIRFNREHPDTVLPIPGLTDCDLFQPCSYKRQEGLQGFVQELDSEDGVPLCKMGAESFANVIWNVSSPIEQGETHVREAFLKRYC